MVWAGCFQLHSIEYWRFGRVHLEMLTGVSTGDLSLGHLWARIFTDSVLGPLA